MDPSTINNFFSELNELRGNVGMWVLACCQVWIVDKPYQYIFINQLKVFFVKIVITHYGEWDWFYICSSQGCFLFFHVQTTPVSMGCIFIGQVVPLCVSFTGLHLLLLSTLSQLKAWFPRNKSEINFIVTLPIFDPVISEYWHMPTKEIFSLVILLVQSWMYRDKKVVVATQTVLDVSDKL